MQNRKRKYLAGSIIALFAVAILGLTWYFSLPSTQTRLGAYIAEMLSKRLGTEVGLERACYSFPNTFRLEGILIDDQKERPMLRASEVSVSISIPSLLFSRQIKISSLSFSDIKAQIVEEVDSTYNFQFVIDSLSTDDSESGSQIDLSVCKAKDVDVAFKSIPQRINASISNLELSLSDISSADSSLSLRLRNLSYERLKYAGQGRQIDSAPFNLSGDIDFASSGDRLSCKIDDTTLKIGKREFSIGSTELQKEKGIISIPSVDIQSEDYLSIIGKGTINTGNGAVDTDIEKIFVSQQFITLISSEFDIDKDVLNIMSRFGDVAYTGTFSKTPSSSSNPDAYSAKGDISTDLGQVSAEMSYCNKMIDARLETEDFSYGKIIDDSIKGMASLDADVSFDLSDYLASTNEIHAHIPNIEYQGQRYSNISIDMGVNNNVIDGTVKMDDPKSQVDSKFSFRTNKDNIKDIHDIDLSLKLDVSKELNRLILGQDAPEKIGIDLDAELSDLNPQTAIGSVAIHSASVSTAQDQYSVDNANIDIIPVTSEKRIINICTDFLDASLSGTIDPLTIHKAFLSQLSRHLPSLLSSDTDNRNDFSFDVHLKQTDMIRQFLPDSVLTFSPIDINGYIDAKQGALDMDIHTPSFSKGDLTLSSISAKVKSDAQILFADISGRKESQEGNSINVSANALAHNGCISSTIGFNTDDNTTLKGELSSETRFVRDETNLKTEISFSPSWISFKNDKWNILRSAVSVLNGKVQVDNVKLASSDRYLILNGNVSASQQDTLCADFHGFDIAYLQDLLNFHPIRLGGKMSGQALLSNILDEPNVNSNLTVDSLYFQEGYLGKADIQVGWNPIIKGVTISADIVDEPTNNVFTQEWPIRRTTTVHGYVAPGEVRDDIQLTITADNTSAEFIHGFLGCVFRTVTGDVNGVLRVTTGSEGVNLIGRMSVDADLELRATDITYHINGRDSIDFVPNAFKFQDVHISDRNGHEGVVNGQVTHRKLRGIGYDFRLNFDDLLVYDEKEFNSDKFLATVSGSGNMTIRGKDGYNVNLNAHITPSKGSVFAYDAATPDAINQGKFITFRSRNENKNDNDNENENGEKEDDYSSDIIFDINIHVTPDCAIRLKMDNNEDGYITAYGYGDIVGRYHNKNPFTLQGVYQIESGKYRLYLQDMIYRDLQLQSGSNVTFNGFPFDAGIHLICHHTLSSVPLRDLTSSVEFLQNSNAKVTCIMDITGKLGNMNFGFNIDLPNVSDETRQMVHSLISTEEEMNMQMIYLLGLGRFYTNEIARAQGKTGTGSEMSSLVSSTLSGQINNMLDSFIGSKSNWNFGTGFSTGEKGWDNLDVEGSLSGRLLDDRLLINGNFGYRDNTLTNKSNFIGDFDIKYKIFPNRNIYIKGYNQTNDKYFTKSTLTTQGIGLSIQKDFDSFIDLFRKSSALPQSLSEFPNKK